MKKFIVCILAIIICLTSFTFVSCKDKGESENDVNVSFVNFEQWGPDFQIACLMNNFGRLSRNSNAEFVKEGEYSAKLEIQGGFRDPTMPYVLFPTTSNRFDFDYQNFLQVKEVVAYAFNASEKELAMTIGLATGIDSPPKSATIAPGDTVVLKPNVWTRIDYWIEPTVLGLSADLTAIKGVYFQFENQGIEYLEDGAPVVYLDDVRFVKYQEEQTFNTDFIELDRSEGYYEICDFEKDYQQYSLLITRMGPISETFDYEIVDAEEKGITAPRGKKVLNVIRHARPEDVTASPSYIRIPDAIMQKAGFNEINEDLWREYYFRFDYYNAGPIDKYASNIFFSARGGVKASQNPYAFRKQSDGTYKWVNIWGIDNRYKNQWFTFEISLYELSLNYKDYVLDPGAFAISIGGYSLSSGEDWNLYFDNFRIEKGERLVHSAD